VRFGDRPTVENWSRIADRYKVISPIRGHLLDLRDHVLGNQRCPGLKLARVGLPADENFDVSATHIYNQDIHDLADLLEGGALDRDHVHEIVPRLDKGLGSFILKLGS
jgi:hypothetical protein